MICPPLRHSGNLFLLYSSARCLLQFSRFGDHCGLGYSPRHSSIGGPQFLVLSQRNQLGSEFRLHYNHNALVHSPENVPLREPNMHRQSNGRHSSAAHSLRNGCRGCPREEAIVRDGSHNRTSFSRTPPTGLSPEVTAGPQSITPWAPLFSRLRSSAGKSALDSCPSLIIGTFPRRIGQRRGNECRSRSRGGTARQLLGRCLRGRI